MIVGFLKTEVASIICLTNQCDKFAWHANLFAIMNYFLHYWDLLTTRKQKPNSMLCYN